VPAVYGHSRIGLARGALDERLALGVMRPLARPGIRSCRDFDLAGEQRPFHARLKQFYEEIDQEEIRAKVQNR
jgi:hypothetical protein